MGLGERVKATPKLKASTEPCGKVTAIEEESLLAKQSKTRPVFNMLLKT